MSTLKRAALCLGAFILACSMVTGCGKSKDEKRTEEQAAATASAGETTTSKFGGDNETSATPKVVQTPRPTAGNSGSAASAMPDKVQSELDDARSFMGAGMYDDAREMLGSVDVEALTDEQLAEYDEIQESLAEEPAADAGFTTEDAVRIAEEAYGISIDGDLFRAKSITQFKRSNFFVGYILFGSCRIACKDRVEERRAGKISCIDKYIVVVIELIVKTTLHAPRQEILKAGHSVQFIRTRGRVS